MSIFSYFIRLPVPSSDVRTVHADWENGTAVIIDVRTAQEHENARIAGSIALPIDDIVQNIERMIPDKDTKIYLHCNAGIRSSHATKMLLNKGYKNARNLSGGLFAWRDEGYSVEENS